MIVEEGSGIELPLALFTLQASGSLWTRLMVHASVHLQLARVGECQGANCARDFSGLRWYL